MKKLKDGLYHKDVYMPKFDRPDRWFHVNYTRHAQEACLTDRYGEIEPFEFINLAQGEIVEIEIENRKIIKLVIRFEYDDELDIVMVIVPQTLNVKTVWLNERNDNHNTLNESRYIKP